MNRRGYATVLAAIWLLACCAAPVCAAQTDGLQIDGTRREAVWRQAQYRIWVENGPHDASAISFADIFVLPAEDRKSLALFVEVEDGALSRDTGCAGLTVMTQRGTVFLPLHGEPQYDAQQMEVTARGFADGPRTYSIEALLRFQTALPAQTAEWTAYLTDGAGIWTEAFGLPCPVVPTQPDQTGTTVRPDTTARPSATKKPSAGRTTEKPTKAKTTQPPHGTTEKPAKQTKPKDTAAARPEEGTAAPQTPDLPPSEAGETAAQAASGVRFGWKKAVSIGAAAILLGGAAILLVLRGHGGSAGPNDEE